LAYLHLGNVRFQMDALVPALESYRRAVELKADQLEAYRGLARAARKLGRTSEADEYDDTADRVEREQVLRSMTVPPPRPATAVR
jgi:tetratricopeptide (TPR) repeat protein